MNAPITDDKLLPHTAVFIDKEGVLVEEQPADGQSPVLKIAAEAREGLSRLAATRHQLILVSTGSSAESPQELEPYLQHLFHESGCRLSGFYCSTDEPSSTALFADHSFLLQAAREHDLCLNHSWFVSALLDDVEAGRRAGCRAILVDSSSEPEWQPGRLRTPDFTAADFGAAVSQILKLTPQ